MPSAPDTHLGAWKNRDIVVVGVAVRLFMGEMKRLRFDSSRRGTIEGDFFGGGYIERGGVGTWGMGKSL